MAGYYGKTPLKGDFISKGLPKDIIDVLHCFLTEGISDSIEVLGEEWLGYYSVAPIWLVYLQPEVVSERPHIGAWIPSVDRVNRHFPLLVLESLEEDIISIGQLALYEKWFYRVEELLLDTLEQHIDTTEVLQKIADLPLTQTNGSLDVRRLLNHDSALRAISSNPMTEIESFLLEKTQLLEREISNLKEQLERLIRTNDIPLSSRCSLDRSELDRNLVSYMPFANEFLLSHDNASQSIWMTTGNEDISPQLCVVEGLPSRETFSKFLIGW